MNHFYVSVVVFSLVAACVLLLTNSNIKRWKKIVIPLLLIAAGTISYRAMNVMYGYPTKLQGDLDQVTVLGFWPDKANKTIYLWVKEPGRLDPISYSMPYSIPLHKKLEGMRQANKGKPYKAKIKSKNYPLERFDETVDDVDIEPLRTLPAKEDR